MSSKNVFSGAVGTVSQRSTEKSKQFEFLKLGSLFVGDLLRLPQPLNIQMQEAPAQLYVHISRFYIRGKECCLDGQVFIHSSWQGYTNLPSDISGFLKLSEEVELIVTQRCRKL